MDRHGWKCLCAACLVAFGAVTAPFAAADPLERDAQRKGEAQAVVMVAAATSSSTASVYFPSMPVANTNILGVYVYSEPWRESEIAVAPAEAEASERPKMK